MSLFPNVAKKLFFQPLDSEVVGKPIPRARSPDRIVAATGFGDTLVPFLSIAEDSMEDFHEYQFGMNNPPLADELRGKGVSTNGVMLQRTNDSDLADSAVPGPSSGSSSTMQTGNEDMDPMIDRSETLGGFSRKAKIRLIRKSLRNVPCVNLTLLRQLAISHGGLVSDELRRQAWPLLALLPESTLVALINGSAATSMSMLNEAGLDQEVDCCTDPEIESHRDYQQILMDVRRTLARFPPNMAGAQRAALQSQLTSLIVRVLIAHPNSHYYQGFHDICLTFLLVVGEQRTLAIIDRLITTAHFRDFLGPTMEQTQTLLGLIYPMVGCVDPELEDWMEQAQVGTMFALSWLITWFGHVLKDFRQIVRLYDLFLASHPLMPLYFASAIVLYRSNEILSCDCDMAMIHSLLQKMPDPLPLEPLISDATDLFLKFPPSAVYKEEQKRKTRKKRWFLRRLTDGTTAKKRSDRRVSTKRKFFSMSFFTFTATVAAWYFYNHYSQLLNWDSS